MERLSTEALLKSAAATRRESLRLCGECEQLRLELKAHLARAEVLCDAYGRELEHVEARVRGQLLKARVWPVSMTN